VNIDFVKLTKPTPEIAAAYTRWETDPALIPLTHPNPNEQALLRSEAVSEGELEKRILRKQIYLIYLQDQLIGAVDYQVNPTYLYKKDTDTAWLGIVIGEETARGKGIGAQALYYIETPIKLAGIKRIELGVFEFNTRAIKLYKSMGYQEIGRINDFTYWQGKMWQDIRMEKYL